MKVPEKYVPPTRPETIDDCHAVAMSAINELLKTPGLAGDDLQAVNNMKEVATIGNTLLKSFATSSTFGFMLKNAGNLKKMYNSLEAFDKETWVPKVESAVQAKVAHIFSEYIRDVRMLMVNDEKAMKKGVEPKVFTSEKVKFLGEKGAVQGLMDMANRASDNRSTFNKANQGQAQAPRK